MDQTGLPVTEAGTAANMQQPNQANPPLAPQQPANQGGNPDQLGQLMAMVQQLAIRVEELSAERPPPGFGRVPLNLGQAGYEQAHPGQGGNPNVPIGQPGLQNPDPQVQLNQRVPPPPPNPPAPRQFLAQPIDAVANWLQAQPLQPQVQGLNAPYGEAPFAPQNYAASQAGATMVHPEENGEMAKLKEHVQNLERMMGERKDDIAELNSHPLYPEAKMPPGFKRSAIDKFDGKGSPKNHIVSYGRTMRMCECGEPEMALCFHLSLVGSAQKWFLGLEKHRVSTWASIVREFMARYKNNEELEITRKHLQMAKQGEKESFGDFVSRFRDLAAQMVDCPKEEDLVEMIVENFTPTVREYLAHSYIPHFKALLSVGAQVESTLTKKAAMEPKKIGSQYTSKKPSTSAIHLINTNTAPFSFPNNAAPAPHQGRMGGPNWVAQNERPQRMRQQQRKFSLLPGTLGRTFEHLREAGLLQPLPPRSPHDPPMGPHANARCQYHQAPGHDTNNCFALRHAIQDLIDNKAIPDPEVPNVAHNPLPNHRAGPGVNAINTGEDRVDPVGLIRPVKEERCMVERWVKANDLREESLGKRRKTVNAIITEEGMDDPVTLIQSIKGECCVIERLVKGKAREFSSNMGEESLDKTLLGFIAIPEESTAQIRRESVYNSVIKAWMKKLNLVAGQGLGKENQGIVKPLVIKNNRGKFGLGYRPNPKWAKPKQVVGRRVQEGEIVETCTISFNWEATEEAPRSTSSNRGKHRKERW